MRIGRTYPNRIALDFSLIYTAKMEFPSSINPIFGILDKAAEPDKFPNLYTRVTHQNTQALAR